MVTFTEKILNGKLHFLCSETADLVTFTEEMRNGKSHFFCAVDLTKIVALPYIQKKSPRGVP